MIFSFLQKKKLFFFTPSYALCVKEKYCAAGRIFFSLFSTTPNLSPFVWWLKWSIRTDTVTLYQRVKFSSRIIIVVADVDVVHVLWGEKKKLLFFRNGDFALTLCVRMKKKESFLYETRKN
jgi:hypothetical protein